METKDQLNENEFNQYKNSAAFYDLDFTGMSYEDVNFYLGLIKSYSHEVLELCCGTGRISIPLAENNITVSALDISKEMLAIFRLKLIQVDENVANRITLIESNMVNFSLNKKFKCILIPFHSFQSLIDTTDISQTLKTVFHHLTDDGICILNLFKPLHDMKIIEGVFETKVVRNSKGEIIYEKKCINTFIDTSNQVLYYDLEYYPAKLSCISECVIEHLSAKYYYTGQIIDLMEKHNFNVENIYYGFKEIVSNEDDSVELTLMCRKRPN